MLLLVQEVYILRLKRTVPLPTKLLAQFLVSTRLVMLNVIQNSFPIFRRLILKTFKVIKLY